jgi:small subunit ribosomal protein S16
MGAKKRPSYRIVAADSRSPRDGRFIEQIGFYDPLTEPATVKFNDERAKYWLSVGAQPSDTVRSLLRKQGLVADERATQVTEPAS